jgi:hypothetical protein
MRSEPLTHLREQPCVRAEYASFVEYIKELNRRKAALGDRKSVASRHRHE